MSASSKTKNFVFLKKLAESLSFLFLVLLLLLLLIVSLILMVVLAWIGFDFEVWAYCFKEKRHGTETNSDDIGKSFRGRKKDVGRI